MEIPEVFKPRGPVKNVVALFLWPKSLTSWQHQLGLGVPYISYVLAFWHTPPAFDNYHSTKDSKHSPNHTVNGGSRELLLSPAFAMASPDVHHLFHHPIADHSFSADRQTLAVARDNNVELYSRSGNKFTLQDELKGHDKTVTSVDIAPSTGRIVTCSQGRSRAEVKGSMKRLTWHSQIAMHMFGNHRLPAGNLRLYYSASTAQLHLYGGLRRRKSLQLALVPEPLRSVILRRRTIGGYRSI